MLNWVPNSYDVFYYNYKIVSQLTDIKKVRNYFRNAEHSFENEYRGFLYFLELVLIQTSYNLEHLIADKDLFERIRWGNNTLEDQDFRKVLEADPEASFIVRLHTIRRNFATLRVKYDESAIQGNLSELRDLFPEIDQNLKNKHAIRRKKNSKKNEHFVIFDHIVRNFNWFKFGPIKPEDAFDIDKEVPLHPGDILTYLMSDKQRSSYFLQDPRIEKNNSNYLRGYKNTIFLLYSHFVPDKKESFREINSPLSDWKDLQRIYSRIMDDFNLRSDLDRNLFELKENLSEKTAQNEQITTLEGLRQILRNREVRCFKDFYNDFNLITHYLFGAVRLAESGIRSKLEIIQFDIVDSKESEMLTYYAIFNPFGGGLWEGSYWLLFRNPYGYGDPDEMKPFLTLLSEISPQQIDLKKRKISEKLIKDFYRNKDELRREESRNREIIKSSRGLLGEFLTLFFFIKKVGEGNIKNIECHSSLQKSDIDVLIETNELIHIAQVKSFFYLNSVENDRIRDHFRMVIDKLKQKDKLVKKYLVFMDHEIHDSEIASALHEKSKTMNEFEITSQEIENQREKIIQEFQKDQIEVIYRLEIQNYLANEKKYEELSSVFNKIF
jgi:hypothetical protein